MSHTIEIKSQKFVILKLILCIPPKQQQQHQILRAHLTRTTTIAELKKKIRKKRKSKQPNRQFSILKIAIVIKNHQINLAFSMKKKKNI